MWCPFDAAYNCSLGFRSCDHYHNHHNYDHDLHGCSRSYILVVLNGIDITIPTAALATAMVRPSCINVLTAFAACHMLLSPQLLPQRPFHGMDPFMPVFWLLVVCIVQESSISPPEWRSQPVVGPAIGKSMINGNSQSSGSHGVFKQQSREVVHIVGGGGAAGVVAVVVIALVLVVFNVALGGFLVSVLPADVVVDDVVSAPATTFQTGRSREDHRMGFGRSF